MIGPLWKPVATHRWGRSLRHPDAKHAHGRNWGGEQTQVHGHALFLCALGRERLKEWKKDIDRCYNSRFGNMSRNKQLILKNISQRFHTTFIWVALVGSPSRHITKNDWRRSRDVPPKIKCQSVAVLLFNVGSQSFWCCRPCLWYVLGFFFTTGGEDGHFLLMVESSRIFLKAEIGNHRSDWPPQKTPGFCSTRVVFF